MASSFVFSFIDRSSEKAAVSFRAVDVAGDGSNWADITTQRGALQTALEGVTAGALHERSIVASRERLTNVVPNDGRREQKWLVRYEDKTSKAVFTFEIPNADESTLPMLYGSDFVDMSQDETPGALMTLVTAIEDTLMISPDGGEIEVLSIEIVGRNT